jgi:hypothetical protein
MSGSPLRHAAGRRPQPGRRIIEFRVSATLKSGRICSSDEHRAVGQQRRGMLVSRGSHAAGRRPQPGSRIIEFRARESRAVISPSDEHLAVGQQRRTMKVAPSPCCQWPSKFR